MGSYSTLKLMACEQMSAVITCGGRGKETKVKKEKNKSINLLSLWSGIHMKHLEIIPRREREPRGGGETESRSAAPSGQNWGYQWISGLRGIARLKEHLRDDRRARDGCCSEKALPEIPANCAIRFDTFLSLKEHRILKIHSFFEVVEFYNE